MLTSSGRLRIRAYTAGGALPVEGARVEIRGASEGNSDVVFTSYTDLDGLSEEFTLPAPKIEYSLSPGSSELPYSVYNLVISKNGYFTKRITGISVFSGVNSIQVVGMIPGSGEIAEDYPRGSINYIIPENTHLT